MVHCVRDHRFVVGGRSFLPFSAEMHYWRVPKANWRKCLDAVREARFPLVSTYVPWNVHEYEEGRFDFAGRTGERTDLVGFVELCAEVKLNVILRPGPWICAEWPNGGMPDYLFDDRDMFALDCNGEAVKASNRVKLGDDYALSYSSQKLIDLVERYYRAFAEAIEDLVSPAGPVFLIQLDNETSWCFRSDAYESDYNSLILKKTYPRFLEEKHGRIARLNEVYGDTAYQSFDSVAPPRECNITEPHDLPRYFDWADFKEQHLTGFHKTLRGMLSTMDIQTGFYTNIRGGKNYVVPNNWSKDDRAVGLVAIDWYWPERYYEAARYFRYLRTCTKTVWAGELMAGLWADDPGRRQVEKPISPEMQLYCMLMCLSVGMKGANYYMFVERDHWYGSPVTNEGEKTATYEVFKRVNEIADEVDLPSLSTVENISLGLYRPYLWYNYLEAGAPFEFVNRLTQEVTPQVAATLDHLGYEYSIADPRVDDSLVNNPILFFESATFMDSDTQLRLARFVSKGGTLILYGLPPSLDLWMKPCKTLASAIELKAYHQEGPALVECATGTISVYRFGFIEGKDWEPLWEEQDRMVAGRRQLGAGTVHFFAASPAVADQPDLTFFLDQVLSQYDAVRPVRTNVAHVRASLHRNNSGMVLFLVNTVNAERHHGQPYWYPIVRFDPRTSGIRDTTYTMKDLFSGEERSVTGTDLVRGIELSIPTRWGARMFHIVPA